MSQVSCQKAEVESVGWSCFHSSQLVLCFLKDQKKKKKSLIIKSDIFFKLRVLFK